VKEISVSNFWSQSFGPSIGVTLLGRLHSIKYWLPQTLP